MNPLATYKGSPVIVRREDGSREILDHEALATLLEEAKVAEAYLKALKAEIKAAVEDCGSPLLEVIEEPAGRDFHERAPIYEGLPEGVRELIGPEEYDQLLSVSVSELERVFETIYRESGRGTKKDGATLFRTLTASMCEAKTRKRLRRRKD